MKATKAFVVPDGVFVRELTFESVAREVAALVTEKNAAYGDSFAKCGEFLRLLFPDGLQPAQYRDALGLVRVFDKMMRIANRKDAFGEDPWRDILGYALLAVTRAEQEKGHRP